MFSKKKMMIATILLTQKEIHFIILLVNLKAGEKAILLMGNNNGIPQHYIFAYGSNQLDAEGHVIMRIIDPADGVDLGGCGNIRKKKGTTSCDFLNTIIKFGH